MTTRSEREKAQKLNEQHQAILSKLLREEDNKYCADCEAKGETLAVVVSLYVLLSTAQYACSYYVHYNMLIGMLSLSASWFLTEAGQLTSLPFKLNIQEVRAVYGSAKLISRLIHSTFWTVKTCGGCRCMGPSH